MLTMQRHTGRFQRHALGIAALCWSGCIAPEGIDAPQPDAQVEVGSVTQGLVTAFTPDRDTTLYDITPGNNNGASALLYVGRAGNGGGTHRGLIRFNVSSLANATVSAASLTLTQPAQVGPTWVSSTFALYRVSQTWGEGTASSGHTGTACAGAGASWNTSNCSTGWTNGGPTTGGAISTDVTGTSTGALVFTGLATQVQNWADGTHSNFGFLVRTLSEGTDFTARKFHSRTGTTPPSLSVTFTCNSGYTWNGSSCVAYNDCTQGSGNADCQVGTSTNACNDLAPPSNSHTCTCAAGFSGTGTTSCTDINECNTNNGGCDPLTVCTNTPGSRTCGACPAGYTGNGTIGCTNIDECLGNPCGVFGTCAETAPPGYTCTCNSGAVFNGTTCVVDDECALGLDDCSPNATCVDPSAATNNWVCTCNPGYSGSGQVCNDVNECTTNNGGCSVNAACTNTIGSRICTCNPGYGGNGVTCDDLNECVLETDNCNANATCTNTPPGSFSCACNSGYTGNGVTCNDVDECQTQNLCGAGVGTCSNTPGSYTCNCNPGYGNTGNVPTGVCIDLNECVLETDNCHPNATCTNNPPGSFTCECNPGYLGTGVSCTDSDECATGIDQCDDNAVCTNTTGDYTCACNPGFTDEGVGRVGDCVDIDECTDNLDNCNVNATCNNTSGSFQCVCNTGYAGNGVTCDDVDECTLMTDNCNDNATCANTIGAFTCTCNAGYFGNGVVCNDINECDPANAQNATNECDEHAACVNDVAGSYRCECWDTYAGSGVSCIDVNECTSATDTCRDDQVCTNTVAETIDDPGFTCACPAGQSEDPAAPALCAVRCGDGIKHSSEACEDANTTSGDGCSNTCAIEPGYICTGTPSTCINTCGDGFIDMFEECDDGAGNSDTLPDACRTTCRAPACGDSVLDSGESCDDGAENVNLPDRCRLDCQLPACGDGVLDSGEECDDRGATEGVACTACTIEPGAVCHDLGEDKPQHCQAEPDAGTPDAGSADAGGSGGNGSGGSFEGGIAPDLPVPTGTSATGCSVSAGEGSTSVPAWLGLSLALGLTVRSRRRR